MNIGDPTGSIEMEGVTKRFGTTCTLAQLDLTIPHQSRAMARTRMPLVVNVLEFLLAATPQNLQRMAMWCG